MSRTRSEDKYPSSVPGESNTPSASDDSEQTSYFAAASQGEMHGEVQPLAAEGAQGVLLPRAAMVLGKNVNISEANLPDGTNPDDSLLTQNIEIPAGYSVNVSEDLGWMEEDGRYVLELEYGRLTASADGRTLDYTLDRPLMNNEEPHQDEIGFDKFEEFELIGPDGAIVPAQVEIPIVDDVPVAIFTDMDGEFETGVKPGQTMTGLWDINFGADDASEPYRGFEVRVYFGDPNGDDYVSDRLALPQKGSFTILKDNMFYGVITFNADGTYSFMAGPVETKLYIGIGTQDADGDITEVRGASIALTISSTYEKPEGPDEYEFATIFFDEANLAEGTANDLSIIHI